MPTEPVAPAGLGPASDLHKLLAWFSPSFPVGAFAWSHGLEWAVESGLVTDRASLEAWTGTVIAQGTGRLDVNLLRAAWEAWSAQDGPGLVAVAEEADILRGSAELALESASQGEAFLKAVGDSWAVPGLAEARRLLAAAQRPVSYPVAVGVAAAGAGLPLSAVLEAYLHAFAANLISAGVRLVPLGQTDGQKALVALGPVIAQAVQASLARDPEDWGSAAPMVDWATMRHETQYTRLFRS